MPAHDNAATARAFNDAFNARDWDAAAGMATADVEMVNVATGQRFQGPDGVRQFLQGWATAFPDGQVETTLVIADDRGAVVEFVGRGTQTGPLQGPAGDIPPTGRAVAVPFASILEMREGKIARGRLYFDSTTLLQQLGLIPDPAQTAS